MTLVSGKKFIFPTSFRKLVLLNKIFWRRNTRCWLFIPALFFLAAAIINFGGDGYNERSIAAFVTVLGFYGLYRHILDSIYEGKKTKLGWTKWNNIGIALTIPIALVYCVASFEKIVVVAQSSKPDTTLDLKFLNSGRVAYLSPETKITTTDYLDESIELHIKQFYGTGRLVVKNEKTEVENKFLGYRMARSPEDAERSYLYDVTAGRNILELN